MLAGGRGIAFRHLVEGSFGFFDVILIIFTAMIYMKVLQAAGILDSVTALLLRAFHRRKTLLLLAAIEIDAKSRRAVARRHVDRRLLGGIREIAGIGADPLEKLHPGEPTLAHRALFTRGGGLGGS